ncbi:50S ribosomal protein L11 [Candidatus Phytoplasma melaleucae]|uniref:Large ribosomal subunit protein uL11 n=1 Tax=Candidatus Phytoplasma melaleucae TaxID=2982630 RepID=A0ABT9DDR9_9MOLU|nr:50S ribosomal protein L11 ['Melaleuca sp.' phytoplasma]MDO8168183.1 50S ribosomal protein L11 ['Melaleuca sp.' phytoplasma]MDV3205423.1 50S ribosomal protein L11 [Weeping tea tree witches'-broom phytoplasma]
MAKKIVKTVKLQILAGKANPAPPVGPALGQAQVNIPSFCSRFNEATKDKKDFIVPVVISVYEDKSFDFVLKTPPASDLLKKAVNISKGSSDTGKIKVAIIKYNQIRDIAKLKMSDLNAYSLENASKIIEGTAVNMGITVEKE